MEDKNYVDDILKEGVKLLTSNKIRFPSELSVDDRILLLQRMIKYFEIKEEYLKCAALETSLYKQIIKQKKDSYVRPTIKNAYSGSSIS
jgi:hypothetical protein